MKNFYYILACLFLMSCSDSDTDNGVQSIFNPIDLSRAENNVANAQAQFSFRLVNQIAADNNDVNWVVSPFSSFVNLSMLANGSSDELFPEFAEVLSLGENISVDDLNSYNRKMMAELSSIDSKTVFVTYNSCWVNEQYSVMTDFNANMNQYYNSSVQKFNQQGLFSDAGHPINRWFTDKLQSPFIMKDNGMSNISAIIANVTHFKGLWREKFPENKTAKRSFTCYDGQKKQVESMYTETQMFTHYYNDECDVVSIPFGNNAFKMYLFLPDGDLNEFLCKFSYKDFSNLSMDMTAQNAVIQLPKFKVEWDETLTDYFAGMGFSKVLDSSITNKFSNLYYTTDNLNEFISHQSSTWFYIEESGAEAKSATSSAVGSDISMGPSKNVEFIVDRPFFYLIKESSTDAVIIAGTIFHL